MTDVVETSTWEPGVYQFETSDPIQGGPSGVDNLPHRQLANRTKYLNDNKVGVGGTWALGGTYTFSGPVRLENGNPLRSGDSLGLYRSILLLNGSDDVHVGDVGNVLSGNAYLRAGISANLMVGSTVKLAVDSNGPRLTSAVNVSDNSLKLISSSWVRSYAAPINSPDLTGTPTAPTPAADDNSTRLSTTAYVLGQKSTSTPLVDGTAAVGVSLKWARADHVHPTDTTRAPVASPTFTGTPAAPTPGAADNSTRLATTAWARGLIDQVFSDQSLAQNGYQKLPGGLVLQWGRATITPNPCHIDFPVAFPNSCFVVVPVTRRNTVFFQAVSVWNETATGFDSYHDTVGLTFAWVAIGS